MALRKRKEGKKYPCFLACCDMLSCYVSVTGDYIKKKYMYTTNSGTKRVKSNYLPRNGMELEGVISQLSEDQDWCFLSSVETENVALSWTYWHMPVTDTALEGCIGTYRPVWAKQWEVVWKWGTRCLGETWGRSDRREDGAWRRVRLCTPCTTVTLPTVRSTPSHIFCGARRKPGDCQHKEMLMRCKF